MAQKVLKIEVKDADGKVIFAKNPATPQDMLAVFALFTGTGTVVTASVEEFEMSATQQN